MNKTYFVKEERINASDKIIESLIHVLNFARKLLQKKHYVSHSSLLTFIFIFVFKSCSGFV